MTAQAFDPLDIPIQGTNLIEASAGTGKTYGIAALFSRLIVLEQMPVESVLVVTFTNAATAELKNRLRARLAEMLAVLETVPQAADHPAALAEYCRNRHEGDDFLPQILHKALQNEAQNRVILRLKAALSQFDNAAIYTIHGFCQRILRDYAFWCESPFDIELADNHDRLLLTAAQDFWRKRVAADPVTAQAVFSARLTPQTLLAGLRRHIGTPALDFRRPEPADGRARADALACWQQVQPQLAQLETLFWQVHPQLKANIYQKATFERIFAALRQTPPHQLPPAEKLDKFREEDLRAGLKKNAGIAAGTVNALNVLGHLHTRLQQAAQEEENILILLTQDFLTHLRQTLAAEKNRRRERTFDDLLGDVHRALTDLPQAAALAAVLARNWQAALIDEFQDTDPQQYAVFERIFVAHGRPLFLVGDPKQAIYRFRGADIHAYLYAAARADRRYTLTRNFRSHHALTGSINHLFRQKHRPFILADIPYPDVSAARQNSRLHPEPPAFTVRWLHGRDNEPANKAVLDTRAAEYCADEIAAQLNQGAAGRLNIVSGSGSRPLAPGDIAVLVRNRSQAAALADALKKRRVQSVMIRKDSVFHTAEAAALAALLQWWLNASHTDLLRFVLAGPLFKRSADELAALNENEAQISAYITAADHAVELWQKHGIYAALQYFSGRCGLETGLLSCGDERALTNYLQLAELLAAEDEHGRPPAALAEWLNRQIQTASDSDEHMLRLESDEALVKIITMHAAKGLQYPVVYCPFLWSVQAAQNDGWQVLQSAGRRELLAPSQLDAAAQEQIGADLLGEELRLFYVALTRAEEQLIVYAAADRQTAHHPIAHLLEGTPDTPPAETAKSYRAEKDTAAMLRRNWLRLMENAPEDTSFAWYDTPPEAAVYTPPQSGQADGLTAREFAPRPFEAVRQTSFTALTRRREAAAPDEWHSRIDPGETAAGTPPDTPDPDSRDAEPANGMAAFPRGIQAGLCLHGILETFDFRRPAAEQQAHAAACLAKHRYEADWLPVLLPMLDAVGRTPLNPQGVSLSSLPPEKRLPEMDFVMHAHDFSPDRVRRALAEAGLTETCLNAAAALDFDTVRGFLNGFIDMTCLSGSGEVCIIDYKSNHLGNHAADYRTGALNEAVAHHHYYFQAWIYAVAAARYLHIRRYPLHTVRIRYLFLRGLDGTGNGVWQWDIPAAALTPWLEQTHNPR
ncbi:exodeoxyribonuclease V subunit beta [Neisseria leonii]|uniref:RecBCD enzyme subunit RecB n=1 Tax=Neisseria leonii TaxID=2995413 RepID=A0A9X4E2G6_9NEIS|nr:exodeoxyribonuclease V subunit beta [Neisseria sp. 51.81]MDD9328401.1 exodeoxyribonuclease V subunit beta [Neisseria sp. 51.81]